jgi:hypothetical protein
MRDPETDAVPRPTTELLDRAIEGLRQALINLDVAAYQETRNNRVELGGKLAINRESIRKLYVHLKEQRESL